jgi:hypothetical protein
VDGLNIGDKITPKWNETSVDHVTKDKEYEVVDVTKVGFWIINDNGKKCFPISTSFRKLSVSRT